MRLPGIPAIPVGSVGRVRHVHRPAARRPAVDLDLADLRGLRYRCLEGCGFCCTFTPEVSSEELARLRTRFPALPVVANEDDGRQHIAFQGGCGACTLLQRRACSAYDLRPAHCRYFPFHVHFGRGGATALVNRSCRGVESDPTGDLQAQFQADVLAFAKEHELAESARQAADVFAQFDANCKEAGVAADAVATARAATSDVSWPGLRRLAAGIGVPFDELWQATLEPLGFEDVVSRPFYLAQDLTWWTFEDPGGALAARQMDETGALGPPKPLRRPKPDSGLAADQLRRVVSFFVERAPFEGQVAWLVDDTDYQMPVADAARLRVLELALEAQWRAQVLWQLSVPPERMEEEVKRFLDGAYLDAPTVAGWL